MITAALGYAANAANGITKIYVTGHSLGGAMAEYLAAHISEFASIFPSINWGKLQFITFGSPGIASDISTPAGLFANQIEQIGHSDDPIFMRETPFPYALSHLTTGDNRILIDLPYLNGGIWDPYNFTPEHDIDRYIISMTALLGSHLTVRRSK